jgi:maleate isomerase
VAPRYDARAERWRIGLIILATDHTTERDFARMRPSDDIALYVNRIANANPTNEENLRRMQPHLTQTAALILPGETLDALVYSCTSASIVIGDALVTESLRKAKPGVLCITPGSAAVAAFEALGVRRISVLTPYTPAVSEAVKDYLQGCGLEILNAACLDIEDDTDMARVQLECIEEAALATTTAGAEGLFISCTALPAASAIERIEQRLGIPVVSSNQATFWQALRGAGCDQKVPGYGRLLRL